MIQMIHWNVNLNTVYKIWNRNINKQITIAFSFQTINREWETAETYVNQVKWNLIIYIEVFSRWNVVNIKYVLKIKNNNKKKISKILNVNTIAK